MILLFRFIRERGKLSVFTLSCVGRGAKKAQREALPLGGKDVKMHTCLGTWLLNIALQGTDGLRSHGEVAAQSSDDQKEYHWG